MPQIRYFIIGPGSHIKRLTLTTWDIATHCLQQTSHGLGEFVTTVAKKKKKDRQKKGMDRQRSVQFDLKDPHRDVLI